LRTRLKTIKSSNSTAVCRDSVVGIGWMVWGSSPSGGERWLLLQKHRAAQGAHSPTYSTGTGIISGWWVAKRPGRDVDLSPPSSAEAKNERSYTSTLAIRIHGV